MQLIRNKKELLGRVVLPQRLTFYHHQTKNLAQNILPIHQKTYLCIRNDFHFVKTLNA